MNELAV